MNKTDLLIRKINKANKSLLAVIDLQRSIEFITIFSDEINDTWLEETFCLMKEITFKLDILKDALYGYYNDDE